MFIFLFGIFSFAFIYDKLWSFNFGKKNYTLKVEVDNSSNLALGTPVLMNGVRIGKVDDIYLDKSVVVIILSINSSILVPVGSEVKISYRGMIGDLVINIFRSSEEGAFYKDGDTINGEGPTSTNEILEKMTKITGQLDIILEDVVKAGTGPLMENIEMFAKNLNEMQKEIDSILKIFKESSQPKFENIVTNIEKTSEQFQDISEKLDDLLQNSKMEKSIENIEKITSRLADISDFSLIVFPEMKINNFINEKRELDGAFAARVGPIYFKKESLKSTDKGYSLKIIKNFDKVNVGFGLLSDYMGGSIEYSFANYFQFGAETFYSEKLKTNVFAKLFVKKVRVKVKYKIDSKEWSVGIGHTL